MESSQPGAFSLFSFQGGGERGGDRQSHFPTIPQETPGSVSLFKNLSSSSSSSACPPSSIFLRDVHRLDKKGFFSRDERRGANSLSSSSLPVISSYSSSSSPSPSLSRGDRSKEDDGDEEGEGEDFIGDPSCLEEAQDIAVLRQYITLLGKSSWRREPRSLSQRRNERRSDGDLRIGRKEKEEEMFHREVHGDHLLQELDKDEEKEEDTGGVFQGGSFSGVHTPAGETLQRQLRFRLRSTLQLLLFLRQMEILGSRLKKILEEERRFERQRRRRNRSLSSIGEQRGEKRRKRGKEEEEWDQRNPPVRETVAAWEETSDLSEG
ncbi:hypothetical protein CSUI_010852, partial [Cystoisospora suis]